MPTILDNTLKIIEGDNIISPEFGSLLSLVSDNTTGTGNVNLEKSLVSGLPNFTIESVGLQEFTGYFAPSFNVSVKFDFNIIPFKTLIEKYFRMSIKMKITETDSDILSIFNTSLFELKMNKNVYRNFTDSILTKTNTYYEYKFQINDDLLKIDKNRFGDIITNPKNVFYMIKLEFDHETFKKEFNFEDIDLNLQNNGKSVGIQLIENYNVVSNEVYYTKQNLDRWLGPTNLKGLVPYTYSKFNIDSELLKLNVKNLETRFSFYKKAVFQDFRVQPIVFQPKIRTNTHSIEKNNNIQVIFDIDWLGFSLDNTPQQQFLTKNENLSNLIKIKTIKVYRRDINRKNSEKLLSTIKVNTNDNKLINYENNDVQFIENKYDLDSGNEFVRSFLIIDKTFNNVNLSGQYKYSIELECENQLFEFVESIKNILSVTLRDIDRYEQNFKARRNIDENEYLNILKIYFDNLSYFVDESYDKQKELERYYSLSNPNTGTLSGVELLREDFQGLLEKFNDLNKDYKLSSGTKKAKTNKTLFSRLFELSYIFKNEKISLNYLSNDLGNLNNSSLIQLDAKEFSNNLFEQLPTKDITIKDSNEKITNRKDMFVIMEEQTNNSSTTNLKKNKFKDESLSNKEVNEVSKFKEFFGNDGILLEFNDDKNEQFYVKEDLKNKLINNEDDLSFTNNTTDTIFDEKVTTNNIIPLYQEFQENIQIPTADTYFFIGYKKSTNGELLMKNPVWIKLTNNDQVKNLHVLCKFEKTNEKMKNVSIMNKYFTFGENTNVYNKLEYNEMFDNDYLLEFHRTNKKKYLESKE